jgi:hypothetical protein
MNIQEIRAKRHQRTETLKKNRVIPMCSVYATPFGLVQLSPQTEERLDAVSFNWRTGFPWAGRNILVKEIFDEITDAAKAAYIADNVLESY